MSAHKAEKPVETNELVAAQPRTPIAMADRGVVLTSLDDLFRFAKCVAESGLAPKGMESPQAIMIAIQMGAELGLSPMSALQNTAIINGRPSIFGDAMLAVCRGSGVFDEAAFSEQASDGPGGLTATCVVRRAPHGKPVARTFSMSDAKQAGLSGKQGPWSQYPKRMLQMRARAWALRDAFADVLRGFKCAEEIRDAIEEDVASTPAPRSLDALTERLTEKPPITIEPPADEPSAEPEALLTLFDALAGATTVMACDAAYNAACGPNGYLAIKHHERALELRDARRETMACKGKLFESAPNTGQ